MMNRDVMNRQMFQNGGYVRMEEGGPAREPTVVESLVEVMRGGSTADVDRFISQNMEMLSQSGNPFAARSIDDFMRRNAPRAPGPTRQPGEPLTDESPEVTKDMIKRLNRIFQSDLSPAPNPLNEVEINNAYRMMLSDKGFTDAEIRELAPNPSGRFSSEEAFIQRYQDGGMAMPAPMPAAPGPMGMAGAPMPAAPSPEQMAAIPFEQAQQMAMQQGIDPAAVEAMLMDVSGKMQNLDNAQNYEEVINGIRENDAPLSVRYAELASIVGKEDADKTPESVLTLAQPVIMMAGVDQGIGSLASEEMTAPVTGDMAGGIMSTVNMGAEEAPPVNFNQGGAVQYFAPQNANRVAMPGGRLGEIYQQQRDVYRTIMGAGEQEKALEEQRNMTQAQMLFDIAQGALSFAGGAGKPKGSPAEQLAAAFTPVLGNIGARAGELQKYKQAQAKEARAMDIAALQQAGSLYAAEEAAATKDVGTPLRVKIYSEDEEGVRRLINVMDTPLTRRQRQNLINDYGEGNVEISAIPKAAAAREVKPGRVVGPDGNVLYNFNMNNLTEFNKAQNFANSTPGARIYGAGTEPAPKGSTGVTSDAIRLFGNADLMKDYGAGRTDENKTAEINATITNYLQSQTERYFDEQAKRMVTRVTQKTLSPEVQAAIDARRAAGLPVPVVPAAAQGAPAPAAPGAPAPGAPEAAPGASVQNPVVKDILGKIGLNIDAPVNLLGENTDVQKAFGSASAVKDIANTIVGVVGGTPYPETQKAVAAVKTLNDNFTKFFVANADLRDSVFSQKKLEQTIPAPSSLLTSLDKAIAQTEATIRSAELALQKTAYALAELPLDSKAYTKEVGKAQQLLSLRNSYRVIADAYYKAKEPPGGSGLGAEIIQDRLQKRKEAAGNK
jgi:hypothetical protein